MALYSTQVTAIAEAKNEDSSPAEDDDNTVYKRHIAATLNSKYENSVDKRYLEDVLNHYPWYTIKDEAKRVTITDEYKRHLGRALNQRYTVTVSCILLL